MTQKINVHELPTVTRKELAYRLQSDMGMKLIVAKKVVDVFFETIHNQLLLGNPVKLVSFGTFTIVQKGARPGRNIHTGETVIIQPRKVVRFRPSRKFRFRVNDKLIK